MWLWFIWALIRLLLDCVICWGWVNWRLFWIILFGSSLFIINISPCWGFIWDPFYILSPIKPPAVWLWFYAIFTWDGCSEENGLLKGWISVGTSVVTTVGGITWIGWAGGWTIVCWIVEIGGGLTITPNGGGIGLWGWINGCWMPGRRIAVGTVIGPVG